MTQNELGFAILGAGMVAEYHLNAIQECADLGRAPGGGRPLQPGPIR